jgi:ATP-dependent RNA helicase RhlE
MPFSHFGLRAELLRGVSDQKFTRPTPIQQEAIPAAMEGRDILASAMTGSGKTAAFILPILHRLADRPQGTTRALVLTPTRELAAQIDQHLKAFARHTRLSGAAIFGGVGMGPQEKAFKKGTDILIATPGRLLDHFRFPYARLQGVEVLVLDEADRMLDMGFLPDIRRILRHLPAKRQTMLFSATLPAPIVILARDLLRNPVTINVERRAAPAVGITQTAYPVSSELKSALLVELLKRGEIRSVIAFTRTKHRANRLADYLLRHGVAAGRIHGNRSQAQRTQALAGFKAGNFPVLVATDLAARGLDVEALSHVVNFDVPNSSEDYVHRVGRTARADATGDALLFVSPEEEANLRGIEGALGRRLPRITLPAFDYTKRPAEKLEVPLARRLAQSRAHHGRRVPRANRRARGVRGQPRTWSRPGTGTRS